MHDHEREIENNELTKLVHYVLFVNVTVMVKPTFNFEYIHVIR